MILKLSLAKFFLLGIFSILLFMVMGVFLFSDLSAKDIAENISNKLLSVFSNINIFKAALVPLPPSSQEDMKKLSPLEELNPFLIQGDEQEELVKAEIENKPGLSAKEEILDDVAEQIDIIEQEVKGIEAAVQELEKESKTQEQVIFKEQSLEEDKELEEEAQNEDEESEELEEELLDEQKDDSKIIIKKGGGVNFCQKFPGESAVKSRIIINEVAWMGTHNSSNDEWIELKNISQGDINLADWQILDKEKQIKVVFGKEDNISLGGFLILERTDDGTLPFIAADFIYTGALNDADESLYLFNNNCQLEDEIIAEPGWPAGLKEEKKTMERSDDLRWHTYYGSSAAGVMGTPKSENSQLPSTPAPTPTPSVNPTPLPDTSPPQVVFSVEPVMNSLSFTLSFSLIDTATSNFDAVTPSTLDGITPSGLDGFIFRWRENDDDWQEDPYYKIEGAPETFSSEKIFQGQDEHTYYFQIKAKDAAQNESLWLPDPPAFTKISLPKTILINEIQIDGIAGAGGAGDDWAELYNPYEYDISLSGWSLQEHSSSAECSIDASFYKKNFSLDSQIKAKGFFLVVDTQAILNLKNLADLTIGWSLTEGNTIYLVKNKDKIETGFDQDIVDKIGLEGSCFPEGSFALNPPGGKSIQRKELGQDTNNNNEDFEIKDVPTPTNSERETL